MRECMNKVEEQFRQDCLQSGRSDPDGLEVATKEALLSDEDLEAMKKQLGSGDDSRDTDIVLRFFKVGATISIVVVEVRFLMILYYDQVCLILKLFFWIPSNRPRKLL